MKSHLRSSIEPGLQTLHKLWKPFVAIELLGLAIVLSYFNWPPVTAVFDRIAEVKAKVGIAFAAIAMPIACGLLPEVFKSLTRVERGWPRSRLTFMLHNSLLFVVLGVIVEFFYLWMNGWLGTSKTAGTVIAKVCIDQFVYSTFFAVPAITFSFNWRRRDYQLGAALRDVDANWFLREVVPVLLVNWAYWIPMGTLMYTLPTKLTFIYGVIGNAASATLLTAIAGRKASMPTGSVSLRPIPLAIPPVLEATILVDRARSAENQRVEKRDEVGVPT